MPRYYRRKQYGTTFPQSGSTLRTVDEILASGAGAVKSYVPTNTLPTWAACHSMASGILDACVQMGRTIPQGLEAARQELGQLVLRRGTDLPGLLQGAIFLIWVYSGKRDARDAVSVLYEYCYGVADSLQRGLTMPEFVALGDSYQGWRREQLSRQTGTVSQLPLATLQFLAPLLRQGADVPAAGAAPGTAPPGDSQLGRALYNLGRLSQQYTAGQDSFYESRTESSSARVSVPGAGSVSGSSSETRRPVQPRIRRIEGEEDELPFEGEPDLTDV